MARSKMKSLNTKQPGTALQNQAPPQELPNHSDEEQQVTSSAPAVVSEPVVLVVDSASETTPAVVDVSAVNIDTSNLNSSTLTDHHHHQSELSAPETPVMTSQNVSRLDKAGGLNTTTSSSNLMHHVSSPLNTSTTITSNNINTNTLSTPSLSSSVSTSSIQHLMSSSISSDKLSGIQLNPPLTSGSEYLDAEEIGHGIPTPECLPQSRKHSIAQSKLVANSANTTTATSPATPRLSTS